MVFIVNHSKTDYSENYVLLQVKGNATLHIKS